MAAYDAAQDPSSPLYNPNDVPSGNSKSTSNDVAAALQLLNNPNADWQSLLPYGQAVAQNNLLYNLPDLYGYAMSGPPAPGTPTLAAAKEIGMFQGNPLAAEQEAYG